MHKMISHSIRYNLLVGWTTFCLQTFNSLWHRFSKELETFLRFWCWHDSITPLLQTCGLLEAVRFGDCGCHLSWTHCHALSFVTRPVMEAAIWGWVHSSYKDQVDGFYDAQLKPKVCQENILCISIPWPPPHAWTIQTRRIELCFHLVLWQILTLPLQ